MSKIGNIDLTKRYHTISGDIAKGLVEADTIGAGGEVKGIPEELTGKVRYCVFGVIYGSNDYKGMASWDSDTGECIWKEIIKGEKPKTLQENINKYNLNINEICDYAQNEENTIEIFSEMLKEYILEKNDDLIIETLKTIQSLSGWKELESATPGTKGKAIQHEKFGKLAGGKLNEDSTINLENFSFFPISGGNIIRMGGRVLRYTNTK